MRHDGREFDELRKIHITKSYLKFAEGSVLVEVGDTKIICAASVEEKVPPFLKGKKTGWVTAEYALMPRSTPNRSIREAAKGKISGRTQEIQRLIGRSLRSVVDLKGLGERTVWIDCDVIQADGGTRTAAVTGAFIALCEALIKLYDNKKIAQIPITNFLAATSVGIVKDELMLDLDFKEDSAAQVDMNVVMTGNKKVVEIQGTAEEAPFERALLNKLLDLAEKGIEELVAIQKEIIGKKSNLIGG